MIDFSIFGLIAIVAIATILATFYNGMERAFLSYDAYDDLKSRQAAHLFKNNCQLFRAGILAVIFHKSKEIRNTLFSIKFIALIVLFLLLLFLYGKPAVDKYLTEYLAIGSLFIVASMALIDLAIKYIHDKIKQLL